jgi:hypothetical protein
MKMLVTLLAMMLTLSAHAGINKVTNGDSTTYQVEINDITLNKTARGLKVQLHGVKGYQGVWANEAGAPQLPVVRLYVQADRINDISVSADYSKLASKSLSQDIIPTQPSMVKLPNQKSNFVKNMAAYKANEFVPFNNTITPAGSINGTKQFLVTLTPARYNPATGELQLQNYFEVTVKNAKVVKKNAPAAMLFVGRASFLASDAIVRYKNFKQEQGLAVLSLEVEKRDTPESIRAKIQAVYHAEEYDLKYALIIGRNEHVPAKKAGHISGVTDHYYRAIDTNNYEEDINGPDIGVGRLTVKSKLELDAIIDKFIKYQTKNYETMSWLNKVAWLATNDRHEVAEGSHNYVIDNYTTEREYVGVYPRATTQGGDKLYAITHRARHNHVINTINKGRTIVNYSGHGATTYWDNPRFNQNDVRNIEAENAHPFVISNACITGQFTVRESFGETWIKAKNGAIMFWGSMDNTYWDEDDILERRMYDGIYTGKKHTFAQITQHALKEHWKHYGGQNRSKYYWETYVTFGDPSIKLHRK